MKKVVTLFTVLAAIFAFAPQSVEARYAGSRASSYTYVSGYASCGCPIYTKRVFSHYDRYNRSVYKYHRQPFVQRCRGYSRNTRYSSGYSKGRYYRGSRSSYYRGSSRGYSRSRYSRGGRRY